MNCHSTLASPATAPLAGAVRRLQRGFTLLELLITIAIAAILVGLAAAPMGKLFAANRVQTEASTLVADLMYARSEAIRRGQGVSVCASSDGTKCSAANTWQTGWIVFPDATQCSTVPTTTQTPLRVRPAFKGGDVMATMYPAAAANTCLSFNRDGLATNLGYGQVLLAARNSTASTTTTRCVSVELGGRVTTLSNATNSSCS